MAWIESHQSLGTHRKLLELCNRLHIDDARAVGMLHYLWWWALDNAPDGDITGVPDKVVATASHWRGNPTLWVQSLRGVGLVDGDTGKAKLHDWDDYAGKLISARISNRDKQRRWREQHRNASVTVTSPSRNGATVPNRTQPNSNVTTPLPPTPPKPPVALPLPEWIDKELWNAFLEMRKKKKATPTAKAIELLVKELDRLRTAGNDPAAVLTQSITRNYTGVFPVKEGGPNGRTNPTQGHNPRTLPQSAADFGDIPQYDGDAALIAKHRAPGRSGQS